MAHFAQLDENNVVLQVIVIDNKDTADVRSSSSITKIRQMPMV